MVQKRDIKKKDGNNFINLKFLLIVILFIFVLYNTFGITLSSVILNATSSDDLTAYPVGASDYTTLIYDWRKESTSIAVLNIPFDTNVSENVSGAIKDYSTQSNEGTLGGGNISQMPTWTSSGISGGAYEFDGTDDYIEIPNVFTFPMTISLWFKTDSSNLTGHMIYESASDGHDGWGGGSETHLSIRDGNPSFYSRTGGVTHFSNLTSASLDTNWHHLAVVFNTTTILYFDNTIINSSLVSGTPDFSGYTKSFIGKPNSELRLFNGTLDEVQVYNRALSPEQIAVIYNSGAPRYNILVNQETDTGESWKVAVTPNNATGEGSAVLSNSLSVGITSLTISVESPTNTSYSNASNILFRAAADATVDTWILNYNGTNITGFTINTSRAIEVGNHHLLLYANDSSGNLGLNDTIYFRVYSPTSDNVSDNETNGGEEVDDTYPIYYPTQIQLENGYEKALQKNWKIQIEFEGDNYILEVKNIFSGKITVSLSSGLGVFNLSEDQTKNLNLDNDDFYDIEVYLKDINPSLSEADLILKLLSEEIIDDGSETNGGVLGGVIEGSETKFWIIIGSIVLVMAVIGVVLGILIKRSKEAEGYADSSDTSTSATQ
jgi:hypothetical protein